MNAVMEWVKGNVFIVVFVVLMIAAAVTLPILSGRMNSSVRAEIAARSQNFAKLTQLENGEVLPGHKGVPNEETLRRYEQLAKVVADDAATVRRAALEHNRKGRGVLMPQLFPEPPATEIDVLPLQFHEKLMDAYGNLLAEIKAGTPPPLPSMREQIDLVRKQFITQDLKKDLAQSLEAEEQRLLTERLSNVRMSICVEAAAQSLLYVSSDELQVPEWNQAKQPSLGELFNWQWEYWVISDILHALHEANRADETVRAAPVKRVLSLIVSGLPAPADVSTGGGGRQSVAGFGGGGGAGGTPGDSGDSGAPSGAPVNPKAPVQKNFAASITGRSSNSLYDVLTVDLDLIVENARLPKLLDALAQYNFMTVTGLSMRAADPFAALQDGFFYGTGPVSEVHLTVETVWLREWTVPFMPKSIRRALGAANPVATETPADA